ncbi:MAG: BNR/Asp-box repeat protein [Ignavibacteria bacterium]|nr:BNR/Asp-box repeat protein [Ignavibacteria bacterium]
MKSQNNRVKEKMIKLFIVLTLLITFLTTAEAQWEPCNNGLNGGNVNIVYSFDKIVLAGTPGNGIFVSTDNGLNWEPRNNGLGNFYINDITSYKGFLYAATNKGIYHSKDLASTWELIDDSMKDSSIRSVKFSDNNIYVYIYNEYYNYLYYSTDNGRSWENIPLSYSTYSLPIFRGDTIYFGNDFSIDFGKSWHYSGFKMVDAIVSYLYSGKKAIYALISGYAGGSCINYSTNDGKNWNVFNVNLEYPSDIYEIGDTIIVGDHYFGILVSTDFGKSWTNSKKGMLNTYINSITFSGANIIIGTNGSGIMISSDLGITWFQSNGISALEVLKIVAVNNKLYAGTTNGLYKSTDEGNNWTQILNLLNTDKFAVIGNKIVTVADSNYLASSVMCYSYDDGKSWTVNPYDITMLVVYCMDNLDSNLFASTTMGIYKKINNSSWESITPSGSFPAQTFYLSYSYILACVYGDFWITEFNKYNWKLTKIDSSKVKYIHSIYMNRNRIFAGTSGQGIYYSDDLGKSWLKANINYDFVVNCFASNGNNVLAGTNIGILLSTDNGVSWTKFNNGLRTLVTNSIAIDKNYIYAGFTNGGVYKYNANVLSVGEPSNFYCNIRITPNPATDFIEISAGTEADAFQQGIKIYSVFGECVLLTTPSLSDTHPWQGGERIDVSAFPSGMYFCVLHTAAGTVTKHFVVVH